MKKGKGKLKMKKLGKKLVLSSLSLGLAVVTLSTTTYAWYTSNTDVSANGMNGAIAGGSDVGLLISKDGSNFTTGVTFTQAEITALAHNGSLLEPLEYRADKTLGGLQTGETAVAAATGHTYLQFSVYVKTTASEFPTPEGESTPATEIPVYFKSLQIKNTTGISETQTTAVLPEYNVLSDYKVGGSASGWTSAKGKYSVDATRALNLGLAVGEQQVQKSTDIGATPLSLNNYVEPATEANLASSVDALDYYNQVMHGGDVKEDGTADNSKFIKRPAGYAPVELAKATGTDLTALKAVSITNLEKAYEIVFTIWLDGWDAYCFDACRGQSFSIDFELTTNAETAAVYAASTYATTATTKQGA